MQYYLNRVEEKTLPSGKNVKTLELSQEGKQYPIKNVALWSDHPRYNEFVVGATLDFELYEQPSDKVNPNTGQPYMNRSVSKFDTPQKKQTPVDAINTGKIDRIYSMVHAIYKEVGPKTGRQIADEAQEGNVPTPEFNGAVAGSDEINPEDIPF